MAADQRTDLWRIDRNHSTAQFAVRHLGISTVRGTFNKVSGTVNYVPSEPSKSSVDVSIDVSSVDTRVEKRDYDLRSPNFFDVAKFPTITFKSKRAEVAGEEKLKVIGDLTIRDVTGEVVLDVDGPTKPVKDNSGKLHVGASASSKLNRRDFGVNGAAATVADEVEITINMELVQAPKPETPAGVK